MLGLGKRQPQLLGQRLGKVTAAQGHAPLPHAVAVGNHQVRGVGSQRQHHDRLGRIVRIELIRRRQILHLVEDGEVVDRQRRKLNDVDLDARVLERLERALDLVALHREQADFGLQREAILFAAAVHLLVVPDDVFQRKGNLLPGFVLDDVGNLLRFDRRQLDEPRQAALARHGNRHLVAAHSIARKEQFERLAHQLSRVGVRLAENLGVFDVIEGIGLDQVVLIVRPAAQRLQRALPNIDTPHGVRLRHRAIPVPRLCLRADCDRFPAGRNRPAIRTNQSEMTVQGASNSS